MFIDSFNCENSHHAGLILLFIGGLEHDDLASGGAQFLLLGLCHEHLGDVVLVLVLSAQLVGDHASHWLKLSHHQAWESAREDFGRRPILGHEASSVSVLGLDNN